MAAIYRYTDDVTYTHNPAQLSKSNESKAGDNDDSNKNGVTNNKRLIPPPLFAMVEDGVYRSGYPRSRNFSFLSKLGLKTCVYLGLHEIEGDFEFNEHFVNAYGIKLYQIPIYGNHLPFVKIENNQILKAMNIVLNIDNHPLLMFCELGAHRTGTLVGCLRKLQSWSLTSIFSEYRRFATNKRSGIKILDMQYIDLFNVTLSKIFDKKHNQTQVVKLVVSKYDSGNDSCKDKNKKKKQKHKDKDKDKDKTNEEDKDENKDNEKDKKEKKKDKEKKKKKKDKKEVTEIIPYLSDEDNPLIVSAETLDKIKTFWLKK